MSSIKHFKRLNSPREFERLYKRAKKRWHDSSFALLYQDSSDYYVAFVASKKVGKAVKRNRARRILKAHFLTFCDQLRSGKYVFVAKAPILESNFHKLNQKFLYVFRRLELLK